MKKLLAIFMALVLSLTGLFSVAALAEDAAVPSPQTVDVKLSLNTDFLPALTGATDENSAKMMDVVGKIVNGLGIHAVTDGVDIELSLTLNDEPMALFALLKDNDGFQVLSDLLPNSILSVSAEDISAAIPQPSIDSEALTQVLAEPVAKLGAELSARIGEPEAVEETFYDVVFTTRTPVNITMKELSLLLLNTAKEITSAEGFSQVVDSLKQYNFTFDPSTIDNAIEQVTNSSDEDQPALDAAMYSNEAGDYLTQFLAVKDEESIAVRTGTVQGITVVDADIMNQLKLLANADGAGNANLNLDIAPQEGMLISIVGNTAAAADSRTADFSIKLNAMDLLAVSLSQARGGELSGALPVEGKTVYSLKDLQDTEGESYTALTQQLQAGLIQLLGKAMQVMPEIATLMQPAPATEAAP